MHNAMLVEVDPTLLRVLIDSHAWLTRCTGQLVLSSNLLSLNSCLSR